MNLFRSDALAGMTYLVTGSSSGIGKAAAILLAESGARIIAHGRDEFRLQDTLEAMPGSGHSMSIAALDSADQTFDWIRSIVEKEGPLNGVFHCAGVELIRPARMIKQVNLNEVFGSSLFSAFGISRALSATDAMLDGGSVVFMSSLAGVNGQVGMSAYGAAKAAINGLVKSLSCELASRNIRVNSIAAGAVHTPMLQRVTNKTGGNASKAYSDSHLLGFGNSNDIANAALYLLSPMSSWVTGSVMVVDGGYTVR